ncbi:uncharacterized protein LOC116413823 [Galleria mellonella]|uniref:Uncharacterized protein LOC116413823 n=1 Tax=Galleria mellonella TaxID=7137 RepID=A0A6J3CD59_GALME|nr:uncharacterized protein LOC116413823 [Galleria mellonella]
MHGGPGTDAGTGDFSPCRALGSDVPITMSIEIDINLLIEEIRKRAPIYDTSTKEYHDRSLKKQLWDEVCQEVFSSVWDSLSGRDKIKYGKEVQKRWSSLRHCFRREITIQKKASCGGAKKRKYIYFDSLLFLLPFTEAVKNDRSISMDESNENILENQTDMNVQSYYSESEPSSSKSRTSKNCNEDVQVITLLKEGNQMMRDYKTYDDGQDEDESFFRSLMPHMRELTGDQKLLLRMEIIKLILNVKQSSNNCSKTSDSNDNYNT